MSAAARGGIIRAMLRPVLLALGLVAVSPALFWFAYGTVDPCVAVATRGPAIFAARHAAAPEEALAARALGPAAYAAILADAGMSPPQCLQLLWRLETARRP